MNPRMITHMPEVMGRPSHARSVRALLRSFTCLLILLSAPLLSRAQQPIASASDQSIFQLHESFAHPPDDCKIMMRWWWFGPSANDAELLRELEQMKNAGIGGVEIATLYPQSLDNAATGFRNYEFLSEEHLKHLSFAAEQARKLGMRVDITLGSGWPFGGPHIPIDEAAGELRVEAVPVHPDEGSVAVPSLEATEKVLAVFLAVGHKAEADLRTAKLLPLPEGPRMNIPGPADTPRTMFFFISSRTGMMVKRPADGAAGFVLDHYDPRSIANHLHAVGEPLLSAFGDHPPYAVFSDSLEDYGSNWTPDLLSEFRNRRGYDLTPWLPALIGDAGPETAAIRHDWGQTLTELADEHFIQPMREWAHQHHTLLRSQTYGFPPVTLSSNRFADLPEGEGKATIEMWRQFSDTRWASSAGHLFGHNVISSETWTWLHSPAFRATPLDMKAEADLHFLQGINQLVGHGWPYSPETAEEPGWRMYAAGAFNAHNPWFNVMPDVTAYMQRVSYALRLGKPVNDVALLLPNDDVWASFTASVQKNASPTSIGGFDETGANVSMDESMPKAMGDKVIPQILDAGFNLDFIDSDAINLLGIPYKVLILPGIDRIPVSTYKKIVAFAEAGGIVIAIKRLPSTAPGFKDADVDSAKIRALSHQLFNGDISSAHIVEDEGHLGTLLGSWLRPDMCLSSGKGKIGSSHRYLETGDLYFIANVSNSEQEAEASFRTSAKFGESWDPFTGEVTRISGPSKVALDLAPYESRLLFFSNHETEPTKLRTSVVKQEVDLSHDWTWTFGSEGTPQPISNLTSWTDDKDHRFFSGRVSYHREIQISPADLGLKAPIFLDFGKGVPVNIPDPLPQFNMRAYLDSPVREAAQVFVNDRLAGYVWHPPFQLNIETFLHAGENDLRLVVGNTAINALAGRSLPTYRLLYDRFGVEFIPQDMQDLRPLPSGILHGVTLKIMKPENTTGTDRHQ